MKKFLMSNFVFGDAFSYGVAMKSGIVAGWNENPKVAKEKGKIGRLRRGKRIFYSKIDGVFESLERKVFGDMDNKRTQFAIIASVFVIGMKKMYYLNRKEGDLEMCSEERLL
jgi:hypothetical protein